jgi:hypothetical protein
MSRICFSSQPAEEDKNYLIEIEINVQQLTKLTPGCLDNADAPKTKPFLQVQTGGIAFGDTGNNQVQSGILTGFDYKSCKLLADAPASIFIVDIHGNFRGIGIGRAVRLVAKGHPAHRDIVPLDHQYRMSGVVVGKQGFQLF